jgi:hypothetical protein
MAIVINGSGTVTGISVGGLPDGVVDSGTLATDSVIAAKLEASAIAVGDLPAGSILQVVSTNKDDTYTMSSTTFATVTGLSATITPIATSSKVFVIASVMAGHDQDNGHSYLRLHDSDNAYTGFPTASSPGSRTGAFCVLNTTATGQMESYTMSYLHSPSTTSAITYNVHASSTATIYVNRSERDNNASNFDGRAFSTITLMEVAV